MADLTGTLQRYSELLLKFIEARGQTRSSVEKKLGWSRGLLTKLLQQKHELKVRHVLQVLDGIGIEPAV